MDSVQTSPPSASDDSRNPAPAPPHPRTTLPLLPPPPLPFPRPIHTPACSPSAFLSPAALPLFSPPLRSSLPPCSPSARSGSPIENSPPPSAASATHPHPSTAPLDSRPSVS